MSRKGSSNVRDGSAGHASRRSPKEGAIARRRTLVAMLIMWLLVAVGPVHGGMASTDPGPMDGPDQWADPMVPDEDVTSHFTENLGQWDLEVRFAAPTAFGRALLGPHGVTYDVPVGEDAGCRVSVTFCGSDGVEPAGVGDAGYPTSYLVGNDPARWATGARSFDQVVYHDVWQDVDVRYYFKDGSLKYDVVLGPTADPTEVQFEVGGCEGLNVSDHGLDILLHGAQSIHDGELRAWYEDGDGDWDDPRAGASADVHFIQTRDDRYGFSVEKEPGLTLIIDPVIMHAGTMVGSHYDDTAQDVEVDGDGNIYVFGETFAKDFPAPTGYYHGVISYWDVVVTKLNHNLSRVLWSTFVGGSNYEFASGMELDDEGDIYITGWTWSPDLPVSSNAFQPKINMGLSNNQDIYVAKLRSDGSAIEYLTYVGGTGPEDSADIKVHDGRAYVVGMTDSTDFPAVDGPHEAVFGDSVFFMLNQNGSKMLDSQFWAGRESEKAYAIAVDENGDVAVGGYTSSTAFPTTPGAFMRAKTGLCVGFIARYSPSTRETSFCTLFGANYEMVQAIAMDSAHNVYIGGYSRPGILPFPLTPDAYDRRHNGQVDAFIAELDPTGSKVLYSTLLGGDGNDFVHDLALDREGRVAVVGALTSGENFTVTDGCHDPGWAGEGEGFVFVLDEGGHGPYYSSFHGGNGEDEVNALRVDDCGNLVIAGTTYSSDCPVSEEGLQTKLKGGSEMFAAVIGELSPPTAPRNLTATNSEDHISLDWDPPLRDGDHAIREYLVLRGPSEDSMVLHAVLGNVTQMDDHDVEHGDLYYYVVVATNGRGASPPSNIASARLVTVPDPPTDFACSLGFDSVGLSWEAPAFTGGLPLREYRLYRSAQGGPLKFLKVLDPSDLAYEDTEVEDGIVYTYQLTPINEFGKSRTSPFVSVRTHAVTTPPVDVRHTYGELFIRLEWGPPEDDYGLPVTAYNVYRSEAGSIDVLTGTTGPLSRALVDTDVEVGVVYVYTVTAINKKGESMPSTAHDAKAMVRPRPPMGAMAEAGEDTVRVTWSPPEFDGDSPVLGYWVYHEAGPDDWVNVGGLFIEGREGVKLAFLHDAPFDGAVRRYRVTAFNAEGESDPSLVAATSAYEVPSAPRAPRIVWGDGTLELEWDPPVDDGGSAVLSYTVHRKAAGEGGYLPLVTLGPHTVRFLDDTTPNGVEHTYRVTARNLAGEGEPSPEVSAIPAGRPGRPEGVTAVGLNASVRVSWEPATSTGGLPIAGYRLYGKSGDWIGQLLAELGPDAREHLLTDMEVAKVYLLAVTAFTLAGESEMSDIVEAVPAGPPSAPVGLQAVWVDDHVHLTWSAPLLDGGRPITGFSLRRDDREPWNWTVLGAQDLSFIDLDVVPGATYNYTLYASNAVASGSGTTVMFTVPLPWEGPPRTREPNVWPLLVLVLMLVLLIAAAAVVTSRKGRGHAR